MKAKYIAMLLLLCGAVLISHNPREVIEPEAKSLKEFPRSIGVWRTMSETMFDIPTLNLLRPTDYVMRTYVNADGKPLSLYVGYHNGGGKSGPIHSPRNCLPSSGWLLLSSKDMRVEAGTETVRLVRAEYAKDSQLMTCYYWYQVRDKSMTGDLERKFAELVGMITERRKDASFIRLDLPGNMHAANDDLVRNFLEGAFPLLRQYLPS